MRYLEEISIGDCFIFNDTYFLVTTDFKKDGSRLCINLNNGYPKWMKPDSSVEIIDIFTFDKDNNILAIKERKKEDVNT